MATESEILQSWRNAWVSYFPDCQPTDTNLLLIRKQWKNFTGAQVGEAMAATKRKREWDELRVDGTLEEAISRYTRGVLNRMVSPASTQVASVTAKAQQQLAPVRPSRGMDPIGHKIAIRNLWTKCLPHVPLSEEHLTACAQDWAACCSTTAIRNAIEAVGRKQRGPVAKRLRVEAGNDLADAVRVYCTAILKNAGQLPATTTYNESDNNEPAITF